MPTERYIVLTESPERADDADFLGPTATPSAGRVRVAVAVEDLSPGDVRDAEASGSTRLARAGIPMHLIAPVATDDEPPAADPSSAATWGLDAVGATTSSRDGAGVTVAVLDTGLDPNHAAFAHLAGRVVTRNFIGGPDGDVHGHGTHCAGTICGGTVGGTRIGVAPGVARLVAGKVLGPGGGSNDVLVRALEWAKAEGAQIVSMSLGIDFPDWVERLRASGLPPRAATSRALQDYRDTVLLFGKLFDTLRFQGVLVVAASGNASRRQGNPRFTIHVEPPGAAEHVVSVGALTRSGGRYPVAAFSNTRPVVSAPGVAVVSARANTAADLVPDSGTSMAAPHVAGVAALWWQQLTATYGQTDPASVVAQLRAHARTDSLALGWDPVDVGAGLVQAPA